MIGAVLKHIPGYSPSLAPGRPGSQIFQLPAIRTEGLLRIDDENVASFVKAVQVPSDGSTTTSPSQGDQISPFFLVASTVPLTITILTSRSCPIKPLGAVNTRNRFRVLDPAFCRKVDAIRAAADAGELSYGASFGGQENPGRRSKRGIEFCITIELFTPQSVVLRQECWYLQPLAKNVEPKWNGEETGTMRNANINALAEGWGDVGQASFTMSNQDTLNWAATSTDYNPIHVWETGAKLFGFSAVIAHGNHVGALIIEQLHDAEKSGEARQICWESKRPFTIALRFTRPMILPATAEVEWQTRPAGRGVELVVKREQKICIEGIVADEIDTTHHQYRRRALNGYVGSHVADQLLAYGYAVRGTARDENKLNAALDVLRERHPEADIEGVIVIDMTTEGAFDEAIAGVTGIAHVASDVSFRSDPEVVVQTAVGGVGKSAQGLASAVHGEQQGRGTSPSGCTSGD